MMNYTSCIRHPENSRFIQLHAWQIEFCKGNHCAALILSYFSMWHDWKLRNDQYYRRANDIAEACGGDRSHNQNAYLFFTAEDLIEGCMGLYGKKTIADGLDLLIKLGVISRHDNPNHRYRFDKTKYFQFYSDVCNQWLFENYPHGVEKRKSESQVVDLIDQPKMTDREGENARWSGENGRPSGENSQAITNTTNKTTNKNQSIKKRDDFFVDEDKSDCLQKEQVNKSAVQPIVDALTEAGLTAKHFSYPDTVETLQRLCAAGATVDLFRDAYNIASRTSPNFGVNYLAKIVDDLLRKKKRVVKEPMMQINKHVPNYREDFKNGLSWMGEFLN